MRTLSSLLGGAVLAAAATFSTGSLYAAEPTLHTIPDRNYPLVQENADKALNVAYLVAGKMCQVGTSEGGNTVNLSMSGGQQMYSAHLIINAGEQTYNVIVMDILNGSIPDQLLISFGSSFRSVTDYGLDGHINVGQDGFTSFGRHYMNLERGRELGKENEPYFQDLYITALDAVIAACEAKQ